MEVGGAGRGWKDEPDRSQEDVKRGHHLPVCVHKEQ